MLGYQGGPGGGGAILLSPPRIPTPQVQNASRPGFRV